MGTKECKHCAEEIKKSAKICIHCGNKQKESLSLNDIFIFIAICCICWVVFMISNTEHKNLGEDNRKITEEK